MELTREQIENDIAEREEFEFIEAARGITVVEQCSRCHCEVGETVSGECLKCKELQ